MTDKTDEAVAFWSPPADRLSLTSGVKARTDPLFPASSLSSRDARIAELEGEIDQLRLTILGGEDAPGYASSLPLAVVLEANRQNVADRSCYIDRALKAEALLEEAVKRAEEMLKCVRYFRDAKTIGEMSGRSDELARKAEIDARATLTAIKGGG